MNPKPQECLALLDKAAASVSADRQSHANLQLAVKILAEFIEQHSDVKEPKP